MNYMEIMKKYPNYFSLATKLDTLVKKQIKLSQLIDNLNEDEIRDLIEIWLDSASVSKDWRNNFIPLKTVLFIEEDFSKKLNKDSTTQEITDLILKKIKKEKEKYKDFLKIVIMDILQNLLSYINQDIENFIKNFQKEGEENAIN